ncbi:GMP synthase-Glutamine amidotransferase [Gemmobacter aquatilis]|uniref:GMP synthase-Glutamine amidotransferase n=1 Tax=Gemmobacter aquatilis TaxID=933059 RepID=A0A1H8EE51_9RHOB|nr:type 1 glutamine amidotransferase [Gemmobacter aquatilis]SEN17851.1 GMP synthase-Glutamine amidotransferase [Gemmobacter aquatilis]
MLIGILQTGQAPDILAEQSGDYPDMFQRLLADQGLEFRTYRVLDMEFPADVAECDGWLITGSRFGAYEDHPFIKPLEAFIRAAYDAQVPMVGICFGHQIIAQALGGKVEKFPGGWSVGPTEYDFGGERLRLNAWHQDQVVEKPAMAEVAACSDFCQNAALVYGDRAFTVQAHPEFKDDFVDGLMKTRGKGVVPDALMAEAGARLGSEIHDQTIAERIAAFFKAPRGAN